MRDTTEFDECYRATSRRMLGYAYAVTGDWTHAQDLVQEAYLRAWRHWEKLAAYDNVEAWLRLVILRQAQTSWLRVGRWRRAMHRHGPLRTVVDAPSEETVLVARALKELPRQQREAMALHYLYDMPLGRVAEDLNVPVGTVKSWLSRGRTALADALEPSPQQVLPLSTEVRVHSDRRKRRRTIAGVVAAVLAVIASAAALPAWAGNTSPATKNPVTPVVSHAPLPAPSLTQGQPQPAADKTLPVSEGCLDRYARKLPLAWFINYQENELCFKHPVFNTGTGETYPYPLPCGYKADKHPSDSKIVDRRGLIVSVASANQEYTYSLTITKYSGDGAKRFISEVRSALDKCGVLKLKGGDSVEFVDLNKYGAGPNRLVVDERNQLSSGEKFSDLYFVELAGNYVISVTGIAMGSGPEVVADLQTILDRTLVEMESTR